MRIALLSALEPAEAGIPRAFLSIGGRSLIAWQADLAMRLGCERIICLAHGPAPELIEIQREIEARGRQFQLIRGPLQLVGLVSADQELVVLADGLVIDPDLAEQVVGKSRAVAALPAEEGIAAGFERIDADRAWGGVLAARANIVERLADMPPDADTVSLLLRLALQTGTQVVLLEKQRLASGELILAKSAGALSKRETALLDRAAFAAPWTAPGTSLANRFARRLAPEALKRGPVVASAVAGVSGLGAVGLAASDYGFGGLLMAAVASFSLTVSGAFQSLASRLRGFGGSAKKSSIANAILDILIIVVLALPTTLPMIPRRIFLPLMLIGLLRVGSRQFSRRISAFFADRTLLALLLAPAAWFGVVSQTLAVLCVLVLASLLLGSRESQITGG